MPFPKIAAIIEMEVKALNTLIDAEESREKSLGGTFLEEPVGKKKNC